MLAEEFTLNELKVAIINEDFDKLEEISKKSPSFSSIEEAQEILSLIKKATQMLNIKKQNTLKEMQKIKKLKEFHEKEKKLENVKKFDFKG